MSELNGQVLIRVIIFFSFENHVSGFKQSILVVFSGRSFKGSLEVWLFKVKSLL